MRVAYSRISTEEQDSTGALANMRSSLEATGADEVIVEIGSGKDDSARPEFRALVERIKNGEISELLVPSQDRIYRNLTELLTFLQTCRVFKVKVSDLNGRDLAATTADGTLLTQINGALDQHRSGLYAEKTARGLQEARKQGFPARPRVPFGLKKVRDDRGRFIRVEIDPVEGVMARARIDHFLQSGCGLTGLAKWIRENQPQEHWQQHRQLRRWIVNPMLTGRLCWHKKDQLGNFEHVEAEPSFPQLITDAEMERIKLRVENRSITQGVKGGKRRMLTSIAKCGRCGRSLGHKLSGKSTWYLRCSNTACAMAGKSIRADEVFAALQTTFKMHAAELAKVMQRPEVDPPGVAVLQEQIKTLQAIPGTEEVIRQKQAEIATLRGQCKSNVPLWAVEVLLQHPGFWVALSDEQINDALLLVVNKVVVDLGSTVAESQIREVVFKTPGQNVYTFDEAAPPLTVEWNSEQAEVAFSSKRLTEALAALGFAT